MPSQTHRRLAQLYEISQVVANLETVAETFSPVLDIATQTLAIRSAILMEVEATQSRMVVWPAEAEGSEAMRASTAHIERAYAMLVAGAADDQPRAEPAGPSAPVAPADGSGLAAERFVVVPLTVAQRTLFGVLQVEGADSLDDADHLFVVAIANQLAAAVARARDRQRDIARRDHAEAGRTRAEVRGAASELLYEEARRAVRTRDGLLASVSHDLRGPLQAILLTADAIAGGADVVEGVGRIQRSAGRMLRLIDDLLDASSIEAGQLAMKRQAHHPGGLVHEALASHEVAAAAKGLTMSAALDPHLPEVHGDAGRILQVLANLIGNAIHVVGRAGRGHITVSATVEDRAIVFAVADDGPGIDQASQAHLFDRYWRSEAAGYKGTGLGLAIASGIVVAHGGRIWVESELGVGATFFFTIPCADDTPLFAAPVADEAAT